MPDEKGKMTPEEAAELLGVDPEEADEAVLRKAFKKQSLKHHPDKNPGDAGATARFQRIGAALEVLIKRARGEDSEEEFGFDPEDIFGASFFRGATQDFDEEEEFLVFVKMMHEFMAFRAA
eukprot:CAMPEP_0119266332 /NCGR_PEP_ID=MMETSP1329-20130426/4860_1 /TAXON_ID=114041 /ORGANISM="Genus nov. species nov., Strain RCC1024" /LENGTH=120 /DNA_ID=CAMNT_0007266203 /DNA_START=159 /DNA_END=517 /DNA_ORIENTATION=-